MIIIIIMRIRRKNTPGSLFYFLLLLPRRLILDAISTIVVILFFLDYYHHFPVCFNYSVATTSSPVISRLWYVDVCRRSAAELRRVTSSFTSFSGRGKKEKKRKMDQLQENKIKQKKKNKRVNKKESRKGKVCVENQDREPIDCQWRPSLYRNCAGPQQRKKKELEKKWCMKSWAKKRTRLTGHPQQESNPIRTLGKRKEKVRPERRRRRNDLEEPNGRIVSFFSSFDSFLSPIAESFVLQSFSLVF